MRCDLSSIMPREIGRVSMFRDIFVVLLLESKQETQSRTIQNSNEMFQGITFNYELKARLRAADILLSVHVEVRQEFPQL